jgi:hypothetical protein
MTVLERRAGGRIAVPSSRLSRLGDGRYDLGRPIHAQPYRLASAVAPERTTDAERPGQREIGSSSLGFDPMVVALALDAELRGGRTAQPARRSILKATPGSAGPEADSGSPLICTLSPYLRRADFDMSHCRTPVRICRDRGSDSSSSAISKIWSAQNSSNICHAAR